MNLTVDTVPILAIYIHQNSCKMNLTLSALIHNNCTYIISNMEYEVKDITV
jgi:hypothetical protein